jgi:F0F1-type ATP synthase epsilon subunit
VAAVGAGFVEAEPDKVLLLTDQFLQPGQIDVAQAEADAVEADKAISAFGERFEGRDYDELSRRLDWARARLAAKAEDKS